MRIEFLCALPFLGLTCNATTITTYCEAGSRLGTTDAPYEIVTSTSGSCVGPRGAFYVDSNALTITGAWGGFPQNADGSPSADFLDSSASLAISNISIAAGPVSFDFVETYEIANAWIYQGLKLYVNGAPVDMEVLAEVQSGEPNSESRYREMGVTLDLQGPFSWQVLWESSVGSIFDASCQPGDSICGDLSLNETLSFSTTGLDGATANTLIATPEPGGPTILGLLILLITKKKARQMRGPGLSKCR